jgi:TPR repeat protein
MTYIRLGARYEDGKGVPKNRDYALYWYKMAAFEKNSRGQYLLALLYNGSNPSLLRIWLLLASENGSNAALGRLGFMTYYGTHGVQKRPDIGVSLIKRSVANGYKVQYYLGIICIEMKMYKEALECFRSACYNSGATKITAMSHYQLGLMLRYGLGCKKDLLMAQAHIKRAVELKHAEAKAVLELLGGEINAALRDNSLWGGVDDTPEFTPEVLEGTRYGSFPDDEKECLLKWLEGELEVRVGQKIGNYLTEELLAIFDEICADNPEVINAE